MHARWRRGREIARAVSVGGVLAGAVGEGFASSRPVEVEAASDGLARGSAVLTAPDASSTFGVAVAAWGDWIAVGDDRAADGLVESGRVHLHRRSPRGAWPRIETISGADATPFDRFGATVSISEDHLLVGAPGPDGVGGGRAEVFALQQGRWVPEAVLEAPGVEPLDRYGAAVAICGTLAVVAAPRRDGPGLDAGGVAVFLREASGWSDGIWLEAPDAAAGDRFGTSVATDGERIVVGAIGDDDFGEKSGSAWVFRQVDGVWQAESKLLPPHGAAREWFGHAVAIDGTHVLVGAPRASSQGTSSGAVWAFAREDGDWSITSSVPAIDGRSGDWFGFALAIDGGDAIAGSPGRDVLGDGVELEDVGDGVLLSRLGRRWRGERREQIDWRDTVRLRGSSVAISKRAIVVGHLPVEDGPVVPGEVWVVSRP